MDFIPFNRLAQVGTELTYLQQALDQVHLAGDGPFTKRCQALLEEVLGVPRVLLTTSCTHALELAALLLDIQPGDEVIVPSFTFVSTANAFVLRGAQPVFVDIREDTLNLDEARIEGAISPKTKAIVPVHYAGIGCEMDPICSIARRHGIRIVEDNAHGLLGRYRGQALGAIGCLATLSFHETKNFSCGEGGALVVNDESFFSRAEIIREKGTNRGRYFRGEVDRYTWVDLGSSYLPSDLLAAILYSQLEARDRIQRKRRQIWERYYTRLQAWAGEQGVRLPIVPEHCEQAFHMFYVLTPSLDFRQALISHLRARNILSVFHYQPLHMSEMGRKFGGQPGDCPVSEQVSERLLRLPFYNSLEEDLQERVIEAVTKFRGSESKFVANAVHSATRRS